ncbi:hypothetical protein RHGRI_008822 [Rhododendron griersonianum]|uniref:Subtilisin-like protease fibronectin type-III domain-containing protein n=1 Tax=Rhododendron griersonianum TaxID=479676 RepID=A0AAV6L4A2_9ERIC|nr:hypothetical protein RHGRI_008822 [Rhododendron griersonianum]
MDFGLENITIQYRLPGEMAVRFSMRINVDKPDKGNNAVEDDLTTSRKSSVTVVPPPGLTAKIEPSAMSFKAVGQKQEFVLTAFNRTVMNVGSPISTYKATMVPPPGLTAKIELSAMSFKAVGQKQEFVLTVSEAINGNGIGNVMSGHNSKVLDTLGVVCDCCDGVEAGDRCSSSWEGHCTKLRCLPWKYHH